MPPRQTRHLYLARHAEPGDDGATLTDRGVRQATLLGRRLADVPFRALSHGPLPRAAETARVVAAQLSSEVPLHQVDAAGDYVPCLPTRDEVGPAYADQVLSSVAGVTDDDAVRGAMLADQAVSLFSGPADGPDERHDLVITHAFTIGWLVREAMGAPAWRWWGLSYCHAAVTVIRYFPDRLPAVVVANDLSHLPDDLRWTGFPPELRL